MKVIKFTGSQPTLRLFHRAWIPKWPISNLNAFEAVNNLSLCILEKYKQVDQNMIKTFQNGDPHKCSCGLNVFEYWVEKLTILQW